MPSWLITLDRYFPIRYLTLATALLLLTGGLALWLAHPGTGWPLALVAAGAAGLAIGISDLRQTRHALLRNYPVIGHLRFLFEWIRPEIRQYFLESDREAVPFSREQRSLVYQRSKNESDKRPFGTQLDVHGVGYEWINHSLQPSTVASHDFRTAIGGARCTRPYAASLFNISAMSFGALSPNAIRALNEGARRGGFYHDTGEGSISPYHREGGGDLVWELGSGYFGACERAGVFSAEKFAETRKGEISGIEADDKSGGEEGEFRFHGWVWFASWFWLDAVLCVHAVQLHAPTNPSGFLQNISRG